MGIKEQNNHCKGKSFLGHREGREDPCLISRDLPHHQQQERRFQTGENNVPPCYLRTAMCGKQAPKKSASSNQHKCWFAGSYSLFVDPECLKILKATGLLLVLHTRFADISLAQTNPYQAPCLMDPVIPTLHQCTVSLRATVLHRRARKRKYFMYF